MRRDLPHRRAQNPINDEQLETLVRAAARGESAAWHTLMARYVSLLWSIALRHGLSESDSADVVQTTWLRLFEHIATLREPARIGSWLATTAQREALRTVSHHRRHVLREDTSTFDVVDRLQAPVDEDMLDLEQAQAARRALASLPGPWRELMEALTSDPRPSYEQIGAELGLPIGSIGPTRGRCVKRLRSLVESA